MSLSHLKLIFIFSLTYISFVGWSSNSWMMLWFIMEIAFLLFVGLVMADVNCGVVELMIKYFISQVFISLMFSALMVSSLFNLSRHFGLLFFAVLLMKLGLVPFHFWVISVLGKLSWLSFLFMMTLAKLLPVLFLYYLNSFFSFCVILGVSAIVGSLGGMSNLVIQKLLGYSSLVHLCWLLLSLEVSTGLFMIYFFCYFFMMFNLSYIFNWMNIYYINQFKVFSNNFCVKFLVFFFALSLAGFPPFLGFILKWLLLSTLDLLDFKMMIFVMVGTSLFSVLFYLELFFYFILMLGLSINWYSHSFVGLAQGGGLILFFYFLIYFFF